MTAGAEQRARRQQGVEELCAATLRALTGDAQLHFRGRRLQQGARRLPVHAPHLRIDTEQDDFADCRALADGVALRLLHSDPQLHRAFCPPDGIARLVFEWLEQMRVETLAATSRSGMVRNLRERFEHWARDFHRAGLTAGDHGILVYAVAQVCWSRLTGRPVLEETEDAIEGARGKLAGALGAELAALRHTRHDQKAFAPHALAIANWLAVELSRADEPRARTDDDEYDEADEARRHLELLLDFENDGESPIALVASGDSRVFAESAQGYRIYTRRYDAELDAASLVRTPVLREYRERLDRLVASQGVNLSRLARLLHATLSEPQRDGWLFGEEEGRIDGSRLAQLVSSPAERRLFRRDRQRPATGCIVSLLVDCSGSMKAHLEAVATMLDILLRALEMAGAQTELLGFTTGGWNGGRVLRDWMRDGRPAHPGRLNELQHLVFKPAERSWRRARSGVAALLKSDLFREGIDGEAVDWACTRLMERDARRRILLVVSDGCPSDAATGRENDAFYLDNHLKDVVARRQAERAVEVLGLGVGLDLSPYYRRCLATDMSAALDNALFQEIVQLIGGRHHR